ncbi:hypothetical protein SAMN04487783_2664 [Agrococcus baldri]|uniref:Uncharacterized protein n=1 Tax=Agrococcus baldri TaxID=153730 RepID=A0AA94HPG3_9MICO|nr:hypothetical protein [Agrococcus baldri]SFS18514.1 hypothetical protein SAMN04487783_2664 [Agrococcus baldri]
MRDEASAPPRTAAAGGGGARHPHPAAAMLTGAVVGVSSALVLIAGLLLSGMVGTALRRMPRAGGR